MDIFEFCLEIIKREGERFNVSVNSATANQLTAATANDVNYDVAHNRCSYIYRCGTINIIFARECYSKFMTDYKNLLTLFFKWMDNPNLTLCSISKGPALDYIALLLRCHLYVMSPPLFKTVSVISKYGAWRNTTNTVQQIISEGQLLSLPSSALGNIEVIQGDPFYDFSTKVKERISNSDVILMSKCLNLQSEYNDKDKISASLMELFHSMKPDALLFCIDTKPAVGLITSQIAKFPGEFLFEPAHISKGIALEIDESYKNNFGCYPVISARGSFFVWKKSIITLPKQVPECNFSTPVKRSLSVNCVNESTSTMLNSCKSKLRESNSLDCLILPNVVENCSTPKSLTGNLTTSVINSECSVQYSPSKIKNISTVSPEKNKLQVYDDIKQTNSNIAAYDKYSPSVNKSTQTELDDITEKDHARIINLTERISKLTASINTLMQMNIQQKNFEVDSDNIKKEICDHITQNDVCNHCSFEPSCSCHGHSACLSNSCSECYHKQCISKSFHIHRCQADHMISNHNHSACTSGTRTFFPSENMASATPNLVIPINSISGDILKQIISLFSETNKKT